MSTAVTTVVVCVLAMGAAGAGFAKDRELGEARMAAGAAAVERPGAFAGGSEEPVAETAGREARRAPAPDRRRSVQPPARGIVRVRSGASIPLHDRPGGRRLSRLGDRTRFGSRTTLAVVRRRLGWLGVVTSVLHNNEVGWIRDDAGVLEHDRTRLRVVVDRSEGRLDLLRGRRRLMSVPVGVGRAGSETPLGTFAVTDKLSGARYGGSYGCCILALSGEQTQLPPGWKGGDRLAIHGTRRRAARSTTAGCVAADAATMRRLMRTLPLGTLVTIRA